MLSRSLSFVAVVAGTKFLDLSNWHIARANRMLHANVFGQQTRNLLEQQEHNQLILTNSNSKKTPTTK